MTKTRVVSAFGILSAFGIWHSASTVASAPSELSLYLLSHKIGSEVAETTASGDARVMRSHFEYLDRGAKVALDSTLTYAKDFTPLIRGARQELPLLRGGRIRRQGWCTR